MNHTTSCGFLVVLVVDVIRDWETETRFRFLERIIHETSHCIPWDGERALASQLNTDYFTLFRQLLS